MAPKRKKGLMRMDAAIDAMATFGFTSRPAVRRVVRQLIDAYGGDDGWPFIEEYSYKVLLEAMLSEQEEESELLDSPKGTELPNSPKDEPLVGTSGIEVDVKTEEPEFDVASSPVCSEAEQNPGGGDNAFLPKPRSDGETVNEAFKTEYSVPSSALVISSSNIKPLGSRPCYGWIESDEEDADILSLEPMLEYKRRR